MCQARGSASDLSLFMIHVFFTCQNTNTSLTMHIADFQRKEIKNDNFLPTWEIITL